MATPVVNFGKVTVSGTYDGASTNIALSTGHGSRLPSTFPYPLTWWNATDYADPADDPNREIVTVTNRVGDTVTVTRGAESTGSSTKNAAAKTYKMIQGITKAMWESIFDLSLPQSFRNLHIQTHPDNDQAASTIMLVHADAIVMHDGETVADWDLLEADMTVTGAGGLDTGSEQASTWYEVYAIAADGASKSLMFHRAKDYLLDQDYSTNDDGAHNLRTGAATNIRLAQGFQVSTAGPLEFVDVKLLKTGSPTGNYYFTIEANSGGVPSNTPLATSDKYDVSRLTTSAGWVRIPFRTPYAVSSATQYHLVLYADYTVSGSNYMSWRCDTSAGAYANGAKASYDGATWTTDTDDDFMFKVYVTENDVAVSGTLPASYTQYALIGYAYNNGSSNLRKYRQVDHHISCGHDANWKIGALGSTNATVLDLRYYIPPKPTTVHLSMYHGAGALMNFGDLDCTDVSGTPTVEVIGSAIVYSSAFVASSSPVNLGPYQGLHYIVSSATPDVYLQGFTW